MTSTTTTENANAYEVGQSPGRRRLCTGIALTGLVVSVIAGLLTEPPTLWGLLPVLLYAVLCLLGMDIVLATVAALASALLLLMQTPVAIGELLGESMADLVTQIGLIIVLGAGVGEILRVTGVAETIVRGILRVVGERRPKALVFGVMLACLVLVTSLGTLAGAIAIAAPIIIPVAARMGFTRSATAAMMFIGGCAGLALAPFAGSNVAILKAAEADYWTYLTVAAGPLAILSLIMGMILVPWMQRRTKDSGDDYDAQDAAETTERVAGPAATRSTIVFLVSLVIAVVYATVTEAGTTFPLLALPVLGALTGLANGMSGQAISGAMYRGGSKLFSMFILFWLLAALFLAVDELKPYDVILATYGEQLRSMSGLPFAVAIALLGWVGIPGATAAQVVLLDKVFGDLAANLGIGVGAWVIVLLWASKVDTYGPFPNANMVGVLGLARSTRLRNLLLIGWAVMAAACLLYVIMLAVML